MTYEQYRWKWENHPKYRITESMPIHIDLELVAGICNCRCIMCEMSFNPPDPIKMPFELAKEIIKQFVDGGGSSIKFVYLGEPLYHLGLPEIIKYAKKEGIIDTIIATNAGLLTEVWSEALIKAGLDWIIFSVDSCKPEIYKQIRVNGNLTIVKKNIKNFYRIRKKMNSKKPQITIQCIPMDLNKDEIESGEYHRFWSPYVDNVRITQLEDYDNRISVGETPSFCCTSPFRRLTIRADGKIALCCGERSDDKILGDIRKNSIKDVWIGEKFREVRMLMKEGKSHLIEQCLLCPTRLDHVEGRKVEAAIRKN